MLRIKLAVKLPSIALPLTLVLATGAFALAPITETLSFDPPNYSGIAPGSSATLTVTITNNLCGAATNVAFTNNLPPGLVLSSVPGGTSDCGGTFSGAPGASSYSYSGGTIPFSLTCKVQVNVTSSLVGTYTDGPFHVNSDQGSSGASSIAKLDVSSYFPVITKSFLPATILPGSTSTLTITIDNSTSAGEKQNYLDLKDSLPVGLIIATPSGATNSCGGTLTADSGTSIVKLANGIVDYEATCAISVDVTTTKTTPATYGNVTSQLQIGSDHIDSGLATAVLKASSVVAVPALDPTALALLAALLLFSAGWFLRR